MRNEVGEMIGSGYRFYQDVRDSHPPGVPWTGDQRVDTVIDAFNAITWSIEEIIEEIKNANSGR